MTLITLSASYGAGGSHVGPDLAARLGVPFLDRAIPIGVAERLAVPLQDAVARDESPGTPLARMAVWLGQVGQAFGAPHALPPDDVEGHVFRRATEEVIRAHAEREGAVVLGRAGAVVLRDDPRALHVRLDGPREARIEQGMRLEGADRATAERHARDTDRARETYVQHYYRVDPRDPSLYHLIIDSTAIPLEACVEIIVTAACARDAERGDAAEA